MAKRQMLALFPKLFDGKGDAVCVGARARRDYSVDADVLERGSRGAKRGNLWVLRSESRKPVKPPRKLHRLRTAKPASDHAEIDRMIETRAPRSPSPVPFC